MQHELAGDSSNTLRVVALDSRHVIQDDQPGLVAAAIDEAASSFSQTRSSFDARLRSRPNGGRCVR